MTPDRLARAAASATILTMLTAALVLFPGSLGSAAEERTVRTTLLGGFEPSPLEVDTGTTVTWWNDEPLDYPAIDGEHRIVADDGSFDSGRLRPKQRFSLRFTEPATIAYRCVIHPLLMTGDLTITGPPITSEPASRAVNIVEPDGADPDSWGFKPDDLKVEEGTTVVWRNNGTTLHTVTADDGTFDSGELAPGETFTYTFERSVALRYACTPHPWMTGLVRVAGASGPPPPPEPPAASNDPPPVVEQPSRVGSEPATWNVLAVEPVPIPSGWGFEPASLTIRAGDTVVWRNEGSTIHTATATAGSFDSGNLSPGDEFSYTFDTTGTFAFACTPHPWMTGAVVVVAADVGDLPEAPVSSEPLSPGDSAAGPPVSPARPAEDIDPISRGDGGVPLAVGTGGTFGLLGLLLIVPTLLERARRRRGGDASAR